MRMRPSSWLVPMAALAALGGCGGPNLPKLPILPLPDIGSLSAPAGPRETSVVVSGTPTGVFAQVARGALGCWFAADGPLKASHVYRAEAEPPAKGGHARIVIHERDPSAGEAHDQRGPLAYRIDFTREAVGVRVVSLALRFEWKVAEAMARDVENWAKGGEEGGEDCRLPAVRPPPAPPVSAKVAKGHPPARKKR